MPQLALEQRALSSEAADAGSLIRDLAIPKGTAVPNNTSPIFFSYFDEPDFCTLAENASQIGTELVSINGDSRPYLVTQRQGAKVKVWNGRTHDQWLPRSNITRWTDRDTLRGIPAGGKFGEEIGKFREVADYEAIREAGLRQFVEPKLDSKYDDFPGVTGIADLILETARRVKKGRPSQRNINYMDNQRTGKRICLQRIRQRCVEEGIPVVYLDMDRYDTNPSGKGIEFITTDLGLPTETVGNPVEKLEAAIERILNAANGPVVILVDSMDQRNIADWDEYNRPTGSGLKTADVLARILAQRADKDKRLITVFAGNTTDLPVVFEQTERKNTLLIHPRKFNAQETAKQLNIRDPRLAEQITDITHGDAGLNQVAARAIQNIGKETQVTAENFGSYREQIIRTLGEHIWQNIITPGIERRASLAKRSRAELGLSEDEFRQVLEQAFQIAAVMRIADVSSFLLFQDSELLALPWAQGADAYQSNESMCLDLLGVIVSTNLVKWDITSRSYRLDPAIRHILDEYTMNTNRPLWDKINKTAMTGYLDLLQNHNEGAVRGMAFMELMYHNIRDMAASGVSLDEIYRNCESALSLSLINNSNRPDFGGTIKQLLVTDPDIPDSDNLRGRLRDFIQTYSQGATSTEIYGRGGQNRA